MKGKVLAFDFKESSGVISAEDGGRYSFNNKSWKSEGLPKSGMSVDFVDNENFAEDIYVIGVGKVVKEYKNQMDGFYRILDQSMMGGVCAGAAHKWNSSRSGLRWATAISTMLFVLPFFVYICLWMVLPKVDTVEDE